MSVQAGVLRQTIALSKRDVRLLFTNRAALISALFIPGLFMLSFHTAFSESASRLGVDYPTFLLPAALLQVVVFASGGSALAMAKDAENGMLDRLRSMPLHAVPIIAGRLAADLFRFLYSGAVVVLVAHLIGFRFHGGAREAVLVLLVFLIITVVLCAFACGLTLLSAKPVPAALLIQGLTIPVIMFSTAFIPAAALPEIGGALIERLPLSVLLDTARALLAGEMPEAGGLVEAAAWSGALLVVGSIGFAAAFRRSSRA